MGALIDALAPVAPLLPGFAAGAAQRMNLICTQIPSVSVSATAYRGKIWVEDSSNFMGSPQRLNAAIDADYDQVAIAPPSTVDYECLRIQSGSQTIPAKLMQRSQYPIALPARQAAAIGRRIAFDFEQTVANLFQDTSIWANTDIASLGGGGVTWDNWETAKPDLDLSIAFVAAREQAYGRDPDTLIIGIRLLDNYIRCLTSQNVALVTSGAAAGPSVQILQRTAAVQRIKDIHGFTNVHVGQTRVRTSAPGASLTAGYIWGTDMWIGCLNDGEAQDIGNGAIAVNPVAALVIRESGANVVGGVNGNDMTIPSGIQGANFPVVLQVQETSLPQVPGLIMAGDAFMTIAKTDANLGYLVTGVVA